jgi:hypothetical protein
MINVEEEFAKSIEKELDEAMGLEFIKQYDFTEEQIQRAREYQKKKGYSFVHSIIDINVIDKIVKEHGKKT